jgi:Uma2 family endonuclease
MVKSAVAPAEKLYTADEFEQMPEFHQNYELIDGRIVQKPLPTEEHSWIARLIVRAYDKYDYDEKVGRMLHEISTRLNTRNTPAPDVAFWTFARKPGRNRKAASVPDLAIEVWSEHDWETQQRLDAARRKCRRYI